MANTKRFTILHSNDLHGDFLAERGADPNEALGGLALLSGYINQVKAEQGADSVLYVVAGDMVQGSIIDSEFKGTSTIDMMNYIAPDAVGLGNHEIDYGLPHLLFLEKIASFPIVNANLYIKPFDKRLMRPYLIINRQGLDILITGILTEKVMDALSLDSVVGTFVSLKEAASEIGVICNAHKGDDIDLTVIISHIGFDSDVALAKMLDPAWGVDMIIGGHSHTVLEQPVEVNGVLVAQAGTGSNQIGRFDITVDDDTNSIVEWAWRLVPIDSDTVTPDQGMIEHIKAFKDPVDRKYNAILTHLAQQLTHPLREVETTLGNLMADALADYCQCDVMLLGAGSVRVKQMGPVVTLGDFTACFPYDDSVSRFTVSGALLKRMFARFMRNANRDGEGECYQVNGAVRAVHDDAADALASLAVAGQDVHDDDVYTVCLQGYHAANMAAYLDVTPEEASAAGAPKVVSTSAQEVLREWLREHSKENRTVEGRLVYR
jgi:5'-nucleotidase/UDP-sugar diphosphatase